MVLTGMGPDALKYGIFIGFLVELLMLWGKYQSVLKAILAYAVFGLIAVTNYIHWLSASEEWLVSQAADYGEDFVNSISASLALGWVFPAIVVGTLVTGVIGGLLGKVVLKKHFAKSGLI